MALQLENVSRSYRGFPAVKDVSLTVEDGEVLALLGPSGSGKSTVLRLTAGLEQPDSGRISRNGRDLRRVPAQHRNFGVVFQDYALFPHLDVQANIAFGLVERRWPRERTQARVQHLLDLTGLSGLGSRRIQQLSGGQQQRVALARALAPEPELLLLDEPFSNLDSGLRDSLTDELAALLDSQGLSAIHVTHDRSEAFRLADRIAILREGRLVQTGTAAELPRSPRDAWVARFLGWRNVFTDGPGGSGPVLLDDGLVSLGDSSTGTPATVLEVRSEGSAVELRLLPPGWAQALCWRGHPRELTTLPAAGDSVTVHIPAAAWIPLAQETT